MRLQSFTLRQKPVTELRFVLAGFVMLGQEPSPQISVWRWCLLAVDLDVEFAPTQGRKLSST